MMLSKNYSKSFIEIEDFGNQTIFNLLKKKKTNKFKVYMQIIYLLNKLQSIRQKKVKNFNNKMYEIPKYTTRILENEAKLFSEWYIRNKLKKSERKKFKKSYVEIIKKLIKKINQKNDTFVHRDFHISNLMMVKNKIGIIDSQDALIGNKAYDLASLIDDVRFKTSERLKNKIFNKFVKLNSPIDQDKLKNDFEILSVLRNLKIIGIFTRLAVRDKKIRYMQMIPYAWKIIEKRTSKNLIFKDLEKKLNKYFSKKLRLKKWR